MVWGKDNMIDLCCHQQYKPPSCNFTSTESYHFSGVFNSFHVNISPYIYICVFFHLNYLSKLPVFLTITLKARKLGTSLWWLIASGHHWVTFCAWHLINGGSQPLPAAFSASAGTTVRVGPAGNVGLTTWGSHSPPWVMCHGRAHVAQI